jgi:hypothetical protein
MDGVEINVQINGELYFMQISKKRTTQQKKFFVDNFNKRVLV